MKVKPWLLIVALVSGFGLPASDRQHLVQDHNADAGFGLLGGKATCRRHPPSRGLSGRQSDQATAPPRRIVGVPIRQGLRHEPAAASIDRQMQLEPFAV